MKRSGGFTLLELLIALILAGVVALIVYGAARAGADAEQRIARKRQDLQAARAMHALIGDALRNTQRAARPGEATFVLEDRVVAGKPADRLVFVSAGGLPPLGSGADWLLTLQAGPAGLEFEGRPLGVRGAPRILGRLPEVTGLDVRIPGSAGRALSAWRSPRPPAAVEITYWSDAGPLGPPRRIAVPLGQLR